MTQICRRFHTEAYVEGVCSPEKKRRGSFTASQIDSQYHKLHEALPVRV
jgi:hypothetical protein